MVFGQDLDRTPEPNLIRSTRGASGCASGTSGTSGASGASGMPRRAPWLANTGHVTPDGAFKHAAGVAFLVVWSIIGLAAFFMSVVCFTRRGSTAGQNMIGLLLSLFLGPFYWLYYFGSGSYCSTGSAGRPSDL
jgi:hypothetical protein